MIVDGKKFCNGIKHREWLPIEQFHRRAASSDGYASRCRSCEQEYHRTHYKSRQAKVVHRRSKLKMNYNITIEDFDRMYKEQGGACAICGAIHVKLVVDHNHATGLVRRLLCHGCNHGLGRFKDDPVLLARAIDYLEYYGHGNVTPGREKR